MTNEEIEQVAHHCFMLMRAEAERLTETEQDGGRVMVRAVVAAWTLMVKWDPVAATTLMNDVFEERDVGWRLVQSS